LSNIYFMYVADNLQVRIVDKINKFGFRLYGTYDLCDSHQSPLDLTSLLMYRLDI
jgi:hypothetical protein